MSTHFPSPQAPPNSLPNIPKKSWATWDFFMRLNYVQFFLSINAFHFFYKGIGTICINLKWFLNLYLQWIEFGVLEIFYANAFVWSFAMEKFWGV
jgi:hypothetical protein